MEIAYRIYPFPNGTIYTEEDVKTIDDVVRLFDYCQILEAIISKDGWGYLINNFGIKKIYQANKLSDWLDCNSIEEFSYIVQYEKSFAYNNSVEHE